MKESILRAKSYAFAIRIVKLSQFLQSDRKEFVLSKQVLKRGPAIGTLIRETAYGQSKTGFINKISRALKKANEKDYWLNILTN